jgi:hypothetical protein
MVLTPTPALSLLWVLPDVLQVLLLLLLQLLLLWLPVLLRLMLVTVLPQQCPTGSRQL